MNENNFEERMDDLRKKLQSIEWDMNQGMFNKEKIPYYKKLVQEYEEIKNKIVRI